jgi:hypothetical protein
MMLVRNGCEALRAKAQPTLWEAANSSSGPGRLTWKLARRVLLAELALGALRAEHRQPVVKRRVGTPLLGSVLVVTRLRPQSAMAEDQAMLMPPVRNGYVPGGAILTGANV